MGTWATLLERGALVGIAALILRYALTWTVVLWSLRTDEPGRRHALAVLRLLHPRLHRRQDAAEPSEREAPDGDLIHRSDTPSPTPSEARTPP
jgi:hypothetical protein